MSSTGVAPSNARMAISVALGLHETRRDRAQIFQRGTRCELLHTFDEVGIMTEMLMIRRVRERVEHGRAPRNRRRHPKGDRPSRHASVYYPCALHEQAKPLQPPVQTTTRESRA